MTVLWSRPLTLSSESLGMNLTVGKSYTAVMTWGVFDRLGETDGSKVWGDRDASSDLHTIRILSPSKLIKKLSSLHLVVGVQTLLTAMLILSGL